VSAAAAAVAARLGVGDIAPAGPPVWEPAQRAWRITRHHDCLAALRSPDIAVTELAETLRRLGERHGIALDHLTAVLGAFLFVRHAPFHDGARALLRQVHAALASRLSPALRAEIATGLLAAVAADPGGDGMLACQALPVRLMAHGLGLAEEAVAGAYAATQAILTLWRRSPDRAALQRLEAESAAVLDRLGATLDGAARAGGVAAEAPRLGRDRYGLTSAQVTGLLNFLILAGIETSTGLLGNMLLVFDRIEGVADRLASDPGLRRGAVEEMLRFLGPIRRASRRAALRPIGFGGTVVPKGAALILDIEAANHDPAAHPDPWRFDPERTDTPHITFSAGAHVCLGAPTARATALSFMEALLRYRVVCAPEPPEWIDHPGFRTPRALAVVLSPRDRV